MNTTRHGRPDVYDDIPRMTSRGGYAMLTPAALLGTLDIANDLANVRAARRWAGELIGGDHPALAGVELCLDELIANSFQHTRSETVSVSVLSTGAAIRVEVADAGAPGKAPHLRADPGNDELEYGRGLHVVAALSAGRWGSRAGAGGRRTTWCEVAATA